MDITHFFDAVTNTLSYVIADPATRHCAVVDSVLDLDYASGTLSFESADAIIAHIEKQGLSLDWLLETHVHADHLSAAPYIQRRLGGRIAIGSYINGVQENFAKVFGEDESFPRDGSQFDVLLKDGDKLTIGELEGYVMHTPGHTPACLSYVFGNAAFVGDTLFMPDYGTARCDFPGGDARTLYRSIQKLLALSDSTRLFVCHDYLPDGRELAYVSTVAEQRAANVHIHGFVEEAEFVAMRETRDATLDMPTLILPSLQVNMRAGHLPASSDDGRFFLRLPLNAFAGPDLTVLDEAANDG